MNSEEIKNEAEETDEEVVDVEEAADSDDSEREEDEVPPAGPWSKEWDEADLFTISTTLMGEKEIDVHDRGATVRFRLEMATSPERDLTLKNVEARLIFPFPEKDTDETPPFYLGKDLEAYKNIEIGLKPSLEAPPDEFQSKGELIIINKDEEATLYEGDRLVRLLRVRTGVFSETDPGDDSPAVDDFKEYEIQVTYEAVELRQSEQSRVTTKLLFFVAED